MCTPCVFQRGKNLLQDYGLLPVLVCAWTMVYQQRLPEWQASEEWPAPTYLRL